MFKIISNIGAIISATLFAFCGHVSLILASLGLGSLTIGEWVQNHKTLFLGIALSLMTLSFVSAINEKKKKGKNTGLIVFTIALVVTVSLLSYNKIKNGYFI